MVHAKNPPQNLPQNPQQHPHQNQPQSPHQHPHQNLPQNPHQHPHQNQLQLKQQLPRQQQKSLQHQQIVSNVIGHMVNNTLSTHQTVQSSYNVLPMVHKK